MNQSQFVSAVLMGCVLILLGVLPNFLNAVIDGAEDLHNSLSLSMPALRRRPLARRRSSERPRGLAVIGAVIISLSAIAYLLR